MLVLEHALVCFDFFPSFSFFFSLTGKLNYFRFLFLQQKANKEGKEFFFGDKCTYIDVAAYHVMAAAESQFPEAYKRVDTPIIKAHKERMEKRPNIAAYLASERRGCFEGNSMM